MKNKGFLMSTQAVMMSLMLCGGFASCGNDDEDDSIDTKPISLYAGSEKDIQGADSIQSSNKFVAYGKGNVVHAFHVGETTLLVNGKKTISISVLPQYHLYDDPVCNWGCDIDYVKKNQKQGTFSNKSTDELIVYENAGAASVLAYKFKNNKLEAVMAVVSTNHSSEYASFLSERYLMLPYYEGADTYFVGADNLELTSANTVVMLQVYSATQLHTIYVPAKNYSTRSVQDMKDMEKKVESFVEKLRNI
ncbi:MAG: hypothetical protein IKQ05_00315 [Prevotella sp.]|nr:hypothetical protein [Prevotella sp.]